MPADIYEIIALGARWWFLLLGALIVLRAFGWLRRDSKRTKRRLRQLPDAGMIGEMVVVCGSDELEEGMVMPVPREGTLGCFRSCDMVVPADGVAPQHCEFSFVNGKGLLIYPRRRCSVTVDGEEFTGLRRAKKHPMTHGSRLQIGGAVLRLRLFEGLETEGTMHVRDAWQLDAQDDYAQTQEAWQQTSSVYHQIPVAWADAPREVRSGAYQQPIPQGMPGWQQPAQPWQHPQPEQPPVQNPYPPQNVYPLQNPYPPQAWQQPVQGQPPVYGGQPYQSYPQVTEPAPQDAYDQPEGEERPHAREHRRRRRRSNEEA